MRSADTKHVICGVAMHPAVRRVVDNSVLRIVRMLGLMMLGRTTSD